MVNQARKSLRGVFRRLMYRRMGGACLAVQRISGTAYRYQPRWGVDSLEAEQVRPTTARWDVIEAHLPKSGSALDIGCNNGFFTFKMAERGLISLGIDSSANAITTARLLGVRNDPSRAAFARLDLTRESAADLPTVDVVLCLSVFHHLVRHQGLDEATHVMKNLTRKTRKFMIFETGQADEISKSWAGELAFMGDNPQAWVSEFLVGLGFARVRQIGSFPGHNNAVERALVIAEKPSPNSTPATSSEYVPRHSV